MSKPRTWTPARRSARAIAGEQQGRVRIAALPVCMDGFLPETIARFLEDHPEVAVELEYADRSTIVELIRSQQFDIGIATMPTSDETGLEVNRFRTQKAVCALPAAHPLAAKPTVHAADLAR